MSPQDNWDFDYFYRVKKEVKVRLSKYSDDERFPYCHKVSVSRAIREQLNEDGIVTLDNGVYKVWFARNYPCYQNNSLLLDKCFSYDGCRLWPPAMLAGN
ncbi:MAG: hypothetical protein Q9N32_07490 [Gammaproteobacteria bacterium]|nr:hypothetical protein [Gammaproteobacteria bacterium]